MPELVFSQPAMLWGLMAASLPAIIHLINRHRARRKPFAAIDFLLRVQRVSARRILLKQLLLLIIRTLLIVALVLAAAGPVLLPTAQADLALPTSSCLVVDSSLSMRARAGKRSRFDAALEQARSLVRGMGPSDAICLLAAGASTHSLIEACSDSSAALLDGIDRIEPEWGTSDLSAALGQAAAALARCPGPNRQVVLLTDAAAHAFPGPPAWPSAAQVPQVLLHDLAADENRANHAVVGIDQASSGPFLEVTARLSHFGPEPAGEQLVEVDLAGQPVARGFIELPAGGSARKVFTLQPPDEDSALGAIRLRPDALSEDDSLAFWVSGRDRTQVLLVNGDMRPVLHQDELFYLEHALAPATGSTSGIRFTTVTPDRLGEAQLQAAEVAFLANVRELGPAQRKALRDWVEAGGGLFVSMGAKIDVDQCNQMLADLLPFGLRDVVSLGPADPDGVHRKGMAFGEFDSSHPALAIFQADQGRALRAIRTRRAVVLEPGQATRTSRVLIRYSNGAAALVEGRTGSGRVLLYTSSLDRDWTNWPARASFLPFLQHAVAYLAGSLDELPAPEVAIGAKLDIPLLPEADGVRVKLPGDRSLDLGPSSAGSGRVTFTGTEQPGWYPVEQLKSARPIPGQTIPGFFVRLPVAESDLTPISTERLQLLLGQAARLSIAGEGDPATRSRAGWLLMLALALVFCEGLLIRR